MQIRKLIWLLKDIFTADCFSYYFNYFSIPLTQWKSLKWTFCLTVLPDLLCLCPEGDVGLFQVEQSPRLGAEVGPVEAGQGHVIAMEAHWSAQLHGVLGQRHLEEGDVAAGDYLQHPGPVAVMGCIHVCVTKTVRRHKMRRAGGVGGVGGRQINSDLNMRHAAGASTISFCVLCCFCPYIASNLFCCLSFLFAFNYLMSMFDYIQLLNHVVNCLKKWYTN